MSRLALSAAVAALGCATCGAASAQTMAPALLQVARPVPALTGRADISSENSNYYNAYKSSAISIPIPPAAIWLPGHYKVNAASGHGGWVQGEFVQSEETRPPEQPGWASALMRLVALIKPSA